MKRDVLIFIILAAAYILLGAFVIYVQGDKNCHKPKIERIAARRGHKFRACNHSGKTTNAPLFKSSLQI